MVSHGHNLPRSAATRYQRIAEQRNGLLGTPETYGTPPIRVLSRLDILVNDRCGHGGYAACGWWRRCGDGPYMHVPIASAESEIRRIAQCERERTGG